jgi:hypothetical protein
MYKINMGFKIYSFKITTFNKLLNMENQKYVLKLNYLEKIKNLTG